MRVRVYMYLLKGMCIYMRVCVAYTLKLTYSYVFLRIIDIFIYVQLTIIIHNIKNSIKFITAQDDILLINILQ